MSHLHKLFLAFALLIFIISIGMYRNYFFNSIGSGKNNISTEIVGKVSQNSLGQNSDGTQDIISDEKYSSLSQMSKTGIDNIPVEIAGKVVQNADGTQDIIAEESNSSLTGVYKKVERDPIPAEIAGKVVQNADGTQDIIAEESNSPLTGVYKKVEGNPIPAEIAGKIIQNADGTQNIVEN